MLTWQPAARNEWFSAFTDALDPDRRLPRPSGDAPGAFSLGDPDRARGLLTGAGFDQVRCQDHREPMYFGRDADDAFRFLAELFGWMLRGLDAGPRTRALDALRADLERHQVAGGVRYGSAAWLITARRP
jgi:hypothetical protein